MSLKRSWSCCFFLLLLSSPPCPVDLWSHTVQVHLLLGLICCQVCLTFRRCVITAELFPEHGSLNRSSRTVSRSYPWCIWPQVCLPAQAVPAAPARCREPWPQLDGDSSSSHSTRQPCLLWQKRTMNSGLQSLQSKASKHPSKLSMGVNFSGNSLQGTLQMNALLPFSFPGTRGSRRVVLAWNKVPVPAQEGHATPPMHCLGQFLLNRKIPNKISLCPLWTPVL